MSSSRRTFLQRGAAAGAALGLSTLTPFDTNARAYAHRRSQRFARQADVTDFDAESGLRITSIETFTQSYATLVRVTADDGSQGFGQLAPYANDITTTVLHQMIAHHALGDDPYKPGAISTRAIEANYKYPWSFVCRATSGLETALWDLRGKREERTVSELLGGSPRAVPAYGSSMRRDITPEDEGARLARLRDDHGFEAFKIRVGSVVGHDEDEWPGRTESIIPAVRRAVGENIVLLADANSCYTPPKAVEVGRMMEDHGYYFFEEPCPFWELEWTAEVNAALDMHVAGGEQDNDLAQWRRMLSMDAVNVTQPDTCYIGGITRTMEVAAMAHRAGKMCVPHSANLSLLTVFALHVMAAIPNPAPYLEFSIEPTDWVEGIYEPMPTVVDGRATFPEGPGWGIRINDDWLAGAAHQISEA